MNGAKGQAGHNVSFSSSLRFAWFRVAKNGTRSLHSLLGAEVEDYCYLIRRNLIPTPLVDLLATSCFRFAFVRNPWDRLVSAWRNTIVKNRNSSQSLRQLSQTTTADELRDCRENFDAFLRLLPDSPLLRSNIHFQPQTEILAGLELDFVGRFERFDDDVKQVLTTIGLHYATSAIPHRNRSSGAEHYSSFYDAQARGAVGDLFRHDIARWGYTFEPEPQN